MKKKLELVEKKKKNIVENFDEKKVKDELLQKINSLLTRKKLNHSFKASDIINCAISNGQIRVKVQCSLCNSIVSCVKGTHWQISNYIHHITHEHKEKTTTISETVTSANSAVRTVNSNNNVLNIILTGNSKYSHVVYTC